MPLISVIVPVYKAETTVRRCVDSILVQTFTDFELLLIDDGSPDNSGVICDEYVDRDSRVRVFHKENGGVSSACNLGLDNAKCDWVAFCDSDDYVYPNWLDNFLLPGYENYDMVVQNLCIEDENGIIWTSGLNEKVEFHDDIISCLNLLEIHRYVGYRMNKLFKREFIEKQEPLRFNATYTFMEDEDFLLHYLERVKNVLFVKSTGYHYFLPNEIKYEIYEAYRLPQYNSMLAEIRVLTGRRYNGVEEKLLHFITTAWIHELKRTKFCSEVFRGFRKFVKTEFHRCKLFYPTKLMIVMDLTMLLSKFMLKQQCKYKNY